MSISKSISIYSVAQKLAHFVRLITSLGIDQFSNLLHCVNQKNICTNTLAKDRTITQMCHYTTL